MEQADLIREKAFELFRRFGIRSITMDDVAGHCGISKKTLYQHYTDKDSLVYSVLEQMVKRSEAQCNVIAKESENAVHEIFLSLDMLRSMFGGVNPIMIYDLHKYHQAAYKRLEIHKHSFLYNVTRKNLERGIQEGLFRSDINVEIITLLHLYTISMTFEQETFPREKFSLIELQMQIMLHYVHGIVSPKGMKLIEKYKAQH
jgi:AcrR family transcriptional regulator